MTRRLEKKVINNIRTNDQCNPFTILAYSEGITVFRIYFMPLKFIFPHLLCGLSYRTIKDNGKNEFTSLRLMIINHAHV